MDKQLMPERQCPECKGPLSWKTVRNGLGAPTANSFCPKCNIVLRKREAPEITRGKQLERREMKGIHCMDKRITRLPCDVQIGILRQRMHPNG